MRGLLRSPRRRWGVAGALRLAARSAWRIGSGRVHESCVAGYSRRGTSRQLDFVRHVVRRLISLIFVVAAPM